MQKHSQKTKINYLVIAPIILAIFGTVLWQVFFNSPKEAEGSTKQPKFSQTKPESGLATSAADTTATMKKAVTAHGANAMAVVKVGSAFAHDYQDSLNLREFIDKVKNQGDKGGIDYAYGAAALCERWSNRFGKGEAIPYIAGEPHAIAQQKQSALEKIRSRCNGVFPGEANLYAKDLKTSPFNQIQSKVMSNDPEKRREGLNALIDIADPLLLESAALYTLPQKVANPEETNPSKRISQRYYDGRWYDGDDERALSQAATTLLPCYFGWSCDEKGLDLLAACVMSEDKCPQSRFEIVRNIYFKGDEKTYKQTLAFAESIAKNIREKNIEPFIVKN